MIRSDPLFEAKHQATLGCACVPLEPGAWTVWHSHLLGQTLLMMAGCGMVPSWGGSIEEICQGDVISNPPGEDYWYGASPTIAMTRISIHEYLDGKNADWLEK
jgi:quercetin dioxygenase-like cupin family protein